MDRVWDAGGQAREALARVVGGFGTAVLGQADMLEGLLQDDVPQLPREVAMLTETARFGVAELLAQRVREGLSAPAAVSMVANEMTSRTAVDAAGALWASGVFAYVIGFGGPTVPPVPRQHDSQSDVTRPAMVVHPPDPEPATRRVHDIPPSEETPADQTAVEDPSTERNSALDAVSASTGGLAVASALGTACTVVLIGSWVLLAVTSAEVVKLWVETLALVAGGIVFAVMAARGRPSGAGFAAVLGLTAPAISLAIYNASIAAESTSEPTLKRYFIVGVSVLGVLTAFAALSAASAGLARWRLIGPQKPPDGLSVVVTLLGLAFVLSNVWGQDKIDGFLVGNVLGPGVRGWFVLWGLVFLVVFALPPIITSFLRPASPAQLGMWSAWLLATLVWQISDTPVNGFQAAYGFYITWIVWLAVLVAVIVLASRRTQAQQIQAQQVPRQQAQQFQQFQQNQGPWQQS